MSSNKRDGKNPSEAQAKSGASAPEFTLTDDMKTFAEMWKISKGTDVPLSTAQDQRAFTVNYNNWVKTGRKRPTMPTETTDSQAPIIKALYRVKSMGIQYSYSKDVHGNFYGKKMVNNRPVYTTKFVKSEVEEVMEDAIKRYIEPQFYFVERGIPYSVRAEDFATANFDDTIMAHKQKRYNF